MKQTSAGITGFYALLQSLYWVIFGLMFNYASMFLLDRGFSNGRIGLVLGLSYAFSACLQPLFASLVSRINLRLSTAMSGIYVLIAALALAILLLPLGNGALAVLMVAMLTLQSAMQPSMNSLHRGYELSGIPVNFSLARGVGSAAFALMSFLTGQILSRVEPKILPAFYLTAVILLLICLLIFRSPSIGTARVKAQKNEQEALLKRYPRFALFLIGLVCLSAVHIFIDNFMLQILQNISGDSRSLGISVAIAGFTELPAMLVYKKLSRRVDGRRLLCCAAWLWWIKSVLTLLARTPMTMYAVQLLQFVSYAIYVPATVDYIARTLPERDFLKGQALSGSAFTLGSLLATLIGGRLIDALGVSRALGGMQIFAFVGALFFTAALFRRNET